MNQFIAYLRTKSFYRNLLVVFLALSAFFLTLSYSLTLYTRHGQGLLVPKLEGMNIANAQQVLEAQGLQYQVDSIYVVDKPPGLVIEQDPDPGTNVKISRTVYLTMVTQKAPDVILPDINGKRFLEVQSTLINYGLKVGDTTYASGIERNIVLQSSLAGKAIDKGQAISKGSRVDLILGDGKGTSEVDLPNLVGLSLNEARMALLGSSLILGAVTFDTEDHTDSLNARVTKQLPMPSDSLNKVKIGTAIDVLLTK